MQQKEIPITEWVIENDARIWQESYFASQCLIDHQARGFPNLYMQIMKYLISKGMKQEDHIILDPMAGIGTTLILANLHGFDSVGIELEEVYYKDMIGFVKQYKHDEDTLFASDKPSVIKIEGNIERFVRVTGQNQECFSNGIYTAYWNDRRPIIQILNYNSVRSDMPDMIKKYVKISGYPIVVTSPPYMRTSEHDEKQIESLPDKARHGHKPMGYQNKENIALIKETFVYEQCLKQLYGNCVDIGAEMFVIVTRDFITEGHVVYLWKHNKNAMELNGFELVDHIHAKLPFKTLFRNINQKKHSAKGLPDIDYEDVCIYKKKE